MDSNPSKDKDFGLLTTKFISLLRKGDEFMLDGKLVTVTKIIEGWPSYHRRIDNETLNMKVFLVWGEQKITLEYSYGNYGAGLRAKGKSLAANKAAHFLRQVEAILILDSINIHNPFHEKSFPTQTIYNNEQQ